MTQLARIATAILILTIMGCSPYKPVDISKPKKIKLDNISLSSLDMEVDLKITNPNFYKITVKDFRFDVAINGVDFGEINYRRDVVIKGNSSQVVAIPFTVSSSGAFSKALSLIRSLDDTTVKIHLDGKVKAKGLLFSKSVKVTRTKNIKLLK